jgi:hypothetical protein
VFATVPSDFPGVSTSYPALRSPTHCDLRRSVSSEARRVVTQSGERRKLTDDQGREWSIFEAAGEKGPCLFFDCPEGFRRVRAYPADWRGLADAELMALSWTR